MNSISVVIATLNRGKDLVSLLQQIESFQTKPHEIIVVDQSESYPLEIKQQLNEILLSRSINYQKIEIKGAAAARNFGVGIALSEYIIFIDDDVILTLDFFEKYLSAINSDLDFDAIAGKVLGLDKKTSYSLPKEFNDQHFGFMFRPMHYGYPLEHSDLGTCNMMIKKSVFKELGGFDENLKRLEDSDFSFRFLKNNYKSYYDPSISLLHKFSLYGAARDIATNQNRQYPSKEYWQQYFYYVIKNSTIIEGKTFLLFYLKPVFIKKGMLLRPLRLFYALKAVYIGYHNAKQILRK